MKKKELPKNKIVTTNELAGTIDKLAIIVAKGFDSVQERFEQVDKRFGVLEEDVSYIKKEVVALNHAQDETNRRLSLIERKQTGILTSLDDTVSRSQFKIFANKVAILEKKR